MGSESFGGVRVPWMALTLNQGHQHAKSELSAKSWGGGTSIQSKRRPQIVDTPPPPTLPSTQVWFLRAKAERCWERLPNTRVSPLSWATGHLQVSCTVQIFVLLFIPH